MDPQTYTGPREVQRLLEIFKTLPEWVTDAKVKLSGSRVHELRDCLQELFMEDIMGCSVPSNSELMELSEPDHRRGSNGVAPVLPSIKRG